MSGVRCTKCRAIIPFWQLVRAIVINRVFASVRVQRTSLKEEKGGDSVGIEQ